MLSPRKVAQAIGVSEASLKRWCDKGRLPVVRTAGGHRRIPIRGVVQFLRETGHALVRPELLSLPCGVSRRRQDDGPVLQSLGEALENGDTGSFRRIVLDLYIGRRSVGDICDRAIAPAFHRLGDRWQHQELHIYQERRACELCMRTLYELAALLPPPLEDAPTAIGGTVHGDPYTIPTAMVELTLRELGWSARSYGSNLPMETLAEALRASRPRLFWVSVSYLQDTEAFVKAEAELYQAAAECGTALVFGGAALTRSIREQIRYSTHCDTLQHLAAFAKSLRQ